jgi:hypothetical protein
MQRHGGTQVLPTPSTDHTNELGRHRSRWERKAKQSAQLGDMVLIACKLLEKTVHKNIHISVDTLRIATGRSASESWDPALACGASNSTICSTFSQLRVRGVHTFRTPAIPHIKTKGTKVRP